MRSRSRQWERQRLPGGSRRKANQGRDPQAAIYRNLEIASRAWSDLSRDPNDSSARLQYNYAVARLVSLLQATGKMQQAGAVTIGTGAQSFKLTFTSDLKSFVDPRNCRFVPADELAISGTYYQQRVRREGIGAPLLASLDTPVENARAQFLVSTKIYYSITALLEFQGDEARLVLKDPLASDTVSIGGRSYPMAADYTIGIAALLAKDRPQRLGFIRMIRPGNYADTARLVRSATVRSQQDSSAHDPRAPGYPGDLGPATEPTAQRSGHQPALSVLGL